MWHTRWLRMKLQCLHLIKEKNKDKKEWQNLSAENYELLAGFFFIAYQ